MRHLVGLYTPLQGLVSPLTKARLAKARRALVCASTLFAEMEEPLPYSLCVGVGGSKGPPLTPHLKGETR